MKDLFGENEGEKIEMRTRLYTSTKKEKTRRKTELTDIDDIDLWRRANGVHLEGVAKIGRASCRERV